MSVENYFFSQCLCASAAGLSLGALNGLFILTASLDLDRFPVGGRGRFRGRDCGRRRRGGGGRGGRRGDEPHHLELLVERGARKSEEFCGGVEIPLLLAERLHDALLLERRAEIGQRPLPYEAAR